ncbi:hypothetical protein TrST_g1354 [Triparma strigata]|uniref:Uncharacterized protein n=1 Tax=Triparma strigata TaxID=1606541 RepID=A0A9W7BPV6_9STRA|nr:hypothetical protein TrST_g1354 [Triparma strigata]
MEALPTLSAYDEQRARNVERNNARLFELGLMSAFEVKVSNLKARGAREVPAEEEEDSASGSEYGRTSMRLQGLAPDGSEVSLSIPQTSSERLAEQAARVIECREARLRAAKFVAENGQDAAEMENATASYEHCLMRVRTMSSKALSTRVRRIENAAGKHCIIKMAVFKSCLQDEGLWELSEEASEALERLKGGGEEKKIETKQTSKGKKKK